jgi:hypothetical protein
VRTSSSAISARIAVAEIGASSVTERVTERRSAKRTRTRCLGLEQYEAAFRANEIDASLLATLTVEDLKDLSRR